MLHMMTGNDAPMELEGTKETGQPPKIAEDSTIITTGLRKTSKKALPPVDEDEPLVDTTAALKLHSKKTERAQKRLHKRQQKFVGRPAATSFLDLPPELLQEVLGYLRPTDLLRLLRVDHSIRDFILENENSLVRDVVKRRYWVLSRCFPVPVALKDVDSTAHPALLSDKRQDMLHIHKKPYQHIKGIDPLQICTCLTCVLAWNNLNVILDLSHWQSNLNSREPIPMISRGTNPEWNQKLLDAHATIVEKAMTSRLTWAVILEKHLRTTVGTILRTFRGRKTVHPRRLYHLTPAEANTEHDEFLERSGPPSFELPWHRDNYYNLEAYVPNRKWSKEGEKWLYYVDGLHEKDLQWVKERFTPEPPKKDKALEDFIAGFKEQAITLK